MMIAPELYMTYLAFAQKRTTGTAKRPAIGTVREQGIRSVRLAWYRRTKGSRFMVGAPFHKIYYTSCFVGIIAKADFFVNRF